MVLFAQVKQKRKQHGKNKSLNMNGNKGWLVEHGKLKKKLKTVNNDIKK